MGGRHPWQCDVRLDASPTDDVALAAPHVPYRRFLPPSYRLLTARTGGRRAIHNTHRHRNIAPGPAGTAAGTRPRPPTRSFTVNAEQHPLGLSILLHLAPGAALTGFVIAANNALRLEPLLGLLIGSSWSSPRSNSATWPSTRTAPPGRGRRSPQPTTAPVEAVIADRGRLGGVDAPAGRCGGGGDR